MTHNRICTQLQDSLQITCSQAGESGVNFCMQGRLARRPDPLRDVRGNSADRVRLIDLITQRKFNNNVVTGARLRWHNFFKLQRSAGFDDLPIVSSQRFGHVRRVNVKVSFASDLIASNLKKALIFAID